MECFYEERFSSCTAHLAQKCLSCSKFRLGLCGPVASLLSEPGIPAASLLAWPPFSEWALLHGYLLGLSGKKLYWNNSFLGFQKFEETALERIDYLKVLEGKENGKFVDKRRNSWVNQEVVLEGFHLTEEWQTGCFISQVLWWWLKVLKSLKINLNHRNSKWNGASLLSYAWIP